MKTAIVILIITVLIIIGFVIFSVQKTGVTTDVQQPDIEDTSKSSTKTTLLIGRILDINKQGITGTLGASFNNKGYKLTAQIENLPEPKLGEYYQGWLSDESNLKNIPLGALELISGSKKYKQEFSSNNDLTVYTSYFVTLESIDNPLEPSQHIVEGQLKVMGQNPESVLPDISI